MENGITSSSSDSEMPPNRKEIRHATFKIQMKIHCYSLKAEHYALFKNRLKKPAFVLKPLKAILNPVVDRSSLQQLEYEMERDDLPDD